MMNRRMVVLLVLSALLFLPIWVVAQDTPVDVIVQGKEGYTYIQSGMPTVLKIRDVGTVRYAFNGSPVEIPFTLDGSGSTVVLAVYGTRGDTEEGWYGPRIHDFTTGGLEYWGEPYHYVATGLDTLLYVSPPRYFQEGPNSIRWDGRDKGGHVLPAGTYTYYLVGVDEQGHPTVVGRMRAGIGAPIRIITTAEGEPVDPPFSLSILGWTNLIRSDLGVDYLSRPSAYEIIPLPENLYMWSIVHDPEDDVNTYYAIGTKRIQVNEDIWETVAKGVVRLKIKGEVVEIDPSFGENGWAMIDEDVGQNRCAGLALHKGVVYATYSELWNGPTSLLYRFDQESGDRRSVDDVSHIWYIYNRRGHPNKTGPEYTGPKDDTDPYRNNRFSRGPMTVNVDDSGIYTSSWLVRRQVKTDFEVNPIWINDPGDGYGDNEYIYNTTVTKYGFLSEPGRGTLYEGFILGPDGSGILNVRPSNVMGHVQLDLCMLLEDTPYDGIYFVGDGENPQFDDEGPPVLVHLPCDIQEGWIISAPVAVEEVEAVRPDRFVLGQAAPNPFNPGTAIPYALPRASEVILSVYTITGQQVAVLVDARQEAGGHTVAFDGSGHASGVYLYRLQAGSFVAARRMLLMR